MGRALFPWPRGESGDALRIGESPRAVKWPTAFRASGKHVHTEGDPPNNRGITSLLSLLVVVLLTLRILRNLGFAAPEEQPPDAAEERSER